MKIISLAIAATTAAIALSASANAHTVTYGFTPGAPGSGNVDIWMGSYHGSGENGNQPEGALDLVGTSGTSYPSTSHAFTVTSLTLPTGLVENDNYFCDTSYCPGGSFSDAIFWQGVSISGLTPGDYQFSFTNTAGTTQVFEPWSSNIGAPFTLEASDIASSTVPLPAGLPLLIGALGAFGLVARRRKAA